MFLVQKRLFCILPCYKSTIHLSSYELCSLFSFSTAKDQISDHKSNFTVVNPLQSCELSSEKAAKTAKCLTCHTKSSSSSLSIEYFKQNGWSDAQVMKLTQRAPKLLRAKVETTLKPRMRSLQDMGFSVTEIVQLVSTCPAILFQNIQPNMNFLRSLLGSNERLLKACRRNIFLLTSSLARRIEPNISLLRECGISDERIARMVVMMPGFVVRKNIFIKEVIEHVEELGVPRDCAMFPYALLAVLNISRSKCDATFATLKSFGWSQPDIIAILRKSPFVWKLSKKNISDKMTFLMKEAGCELQYIIRHPVLLSVSLEKTLRPRHEVINFLEQNNLLDKGHSLVSVLLLTDGKFINKYLFPYKEKFTALYSSYVAAVQGKHHVVAEN
ncbi:unnamed protein product [Musa acuminata subsp. burmannicoides]